MNSALPLRFVRLACLSLLFATVFSVAKAAAQNAAETARITANLPAESRAVIDRLTMLRELPDGPWKMHAGTLAHGEAVSLDESDWQPIALKTKAPNDALWFRQSYQIPPTLAGYDLTGARIWFQFHASANGPMPEILYFNGRRVAMGDDLEPVPLFESAHPGDKVTVAVKLLHTVDMKTFLGATLKIDFPEGRPNPEDLREEFLSAAQLVPVLAPNDPAQLATLNAAIQAMDLKALDANDQKKVDASLDAAREKLAALKPLLQQVTYHLTGNSHIDAAWLWPWTETVDVVKRTFGTALQLMNEYPAYSYSQSAAAYNEWLADKYPSMNAEIARRIKEGRWEIVGGMWVEPDLNMPDGESLVRQVLVGKRWFKQNYGVDTRIGWNPDSFGYTWQLPQIYKKSGIDYFVTQKMAWNDTNQMPFKFFWWQSPDGSKVLSYFPHDYANDNLNPVRLARDFVIAQKQATGLPSMMDLYGIGDHGGGPTRAILDEGYYWITRGVPDPIIPKMQFGTAQSYFSTLETKIAPESPVWDYQSIAKGYTPPPAVPGKVSIPTWKSELYFEYHRGVMTTQANHKKNMRESEVEVLNAEKFSSIAWLYGAKYPAAELTEDWKKVLFNQFHDLAAGSGIGDIYKDAQKDYDVVRWSTNEIDAGALETVLNKIDTSTKGETQIPIVVFNPLGWRRSGSIDISLQLNAKSDSFFMVEDEGDYVPPSAAWVVSNDSNSGSAILRIPVRAVPAFGYKTIRLHPLHPGGGKLPFSLGETEEPTQIKLENSSIRIIVNKETGCITSLFDKKVGFETVTSGGCANELQVFKDTPTNYDAWNIDPGTLDQPFTSITKADSVELVWTFTRHPAIRVTRTWQNSKFIQTISINNDGDQIDSDQVDIDNEIDWHESHVLLKAAFPLAASGPFATYEIPYGTIDRPTTRNNSWEKAQFEVEALRWA
ncbi:MAG: glycoside hydrolase family 38 C-terminal domain-containing protein, partial [Terracidiphilus sp.]